MQVLAIRMLEQNIVFYEAKLEIRDRQRMHIDNKIPRLLRKIANKQTSATNKNKTFTLRVYITQARQKNV